MGSRGSLLAEGNTKQMCRGEERRGEQGREEEEKGKMGREIEREVEQLNAKALG